MLSTSTLVASVLAAAIPLAAAAPTYPIPTSLSNFLASSDSSSDGCTLPENFVVEQFEIWTPRGANNHSSVINFAYWDNDTDLQTVCAYNGSSVNVAGPGLTPRYACENPAVEFIYQAGYLTMIEKVCPENAGWEASGEVTFNLTCVPTTTISQFGAGKDCLSGEPFVTGNFTSLEPTPQ